MLYGHLTGWEARGICWWCGQPHKRRAHCCSQGCLNSYLETFGWPWASEAALKRAYYRCQACGMSRGGLETLHGKYRIWEPKLEVHHIKPLNGDDRLWSHLNIPSYLIVLCHGCHQAAHAQLREAIKPGWQLMLELD